MTRVSSLLLLVLPALAIAGDVNGDGYAELLIGVPRESSGEGRAHLIFGSATGPDANIEQYFDQGMLSDTTETNDWFGWAVAFGDFDGDGFDDVAFGAPNEDSALLTDAGVVHVAYGTVLGLSTAGDQRWTRNVAGVPGPANTNAKFGFSLVSGHFNDDTYADLAIGVPGDVGGGSVNVLYGSAGGLTTTDAQVFTNTNLGALAATSSNFGYSLEAADFDDDTLDDLAIGCPDCNGGSGGVFVVPGGSLTLDDAAAELWDQDTGTILGATNGTDGFGWSLATGDLDCDGTPDLVVGSPYDTESGNPAESGAVNIILGSATGLTDVSNELRTQATLFGTPNTGDGFGWTLAVGRFEGFGPGVCTYLAIGSPYDNDVAATEGGQVHVLQASTTGLDLASEVVWDQTDFGLAHETNDMFGGGLAVGNFDGDSYADLAIGVVGEDTFRGTVQIAYGSATGLGTVPTEIDQDVAGIEDMGEMWEYFGESIGR